MEFHGNPVKTGVSFVARTIKQLMFSREVKLSNCKTETTVICLIRVPGALARSDPIDKIE